MGQKKVVSIEDRIPKLKQARKKKANRRLIFYLSIFFILISIVVYLQSPLSNVQHINVTGYKYIEEEEIKGLSGITHDENIWSVNLGEIEQTIQQHPQIKNVTVSRSFPTTINIDVLEYEMVGYIEQQGEYFPLLENGERLASHPMGSVKADAPFLTGFSTSTYLQELAEELILLPNPISNLISEIIWQPTEGNPYKVLVFMNDGYEVEASIRNFSKSMKVYPSITSQLEQGSKGIIRIGVGGAVFDPYTNESSSDIEEENKDETEG
ncbi:FtsQ-type POTRA domain-containing protein [Aquibacillus koreensis]|uniref:Cell division protein DivIB n=1 Tax=Aquibacillus koreensis TaxID=279446 RepID=A0A9X4AJM7_9BACI|nr:FtsQ-type POTRA domain-containing protein [Aquibacillus koreensis]MCT2538057.1 FtsQ-type POTRA domain-containing protein [Aquibacillus koreensis]MDC3420580.1 FtsQ-type POTRA domain-containing protein [Aquibacillus koreensis]